MSILSEHRTDPGTKKYLGGSHRIFDPGATVDRVKPYMPVMGITRIANVTGLDRIGIPVTMVCRPNSRSVATSQGKGVSLSAAEASGLMEAVETYHAERITLPLKHASYNELRYTHNLVAVEHLPQAQKGKFHDDLPLLWIEGCDVCTDRLVWLPYELVHTNYTRPLPSGSGCFQASSNGLASGNHILEAVSHAICEIVERDGVALWRQLDRSQQNARRVSLESVEDPLCCALLQQLHDAAIDVAVWDVTSDIGISSILCWIMERGGEERLLGRPTVGAGCHPVREIALSRALTEAAQERLALIAGSRDDLDRAYYADMAIRDIFNIKPSIDFCQIPTQQLGSCEQDVAWQLERLASAGLSEVVLIDLSRREFRNVAVVRVVIPGLEGVADSPSYVPGPRAQSAVDHMK